MEEARRERAGRARRRSAWVAILLLVIAWGVTWPCPPQTPEACMDPGEATSRDGRSVAVRCDVPDGPAVRGPGRLLFGQPLDLNRATAASLEALPGIGPSRAAAIVSERERRPFQRVGDLQRVRGIGPRTLEGLEGLVTVGGAPGGRDR